MGIIVNWAWLPLYGGSLGIKLTCYNPLKNFFFNLHIYGMNYTNDLVGLEGVGVITVIS